MRGEMRTCWLARLPPRHQALFLVLISEKSGSMADCPAEVTQERPMAHESLASAVNTLEGSRTNQQSLGGSTRFLLSVGRGSVAGQAGSDDRMRPGTVTEVRRMADTPSGHSDKTPRYLRFGWCGARLHHVIDHVTARFCARQPQSDFAGMAIAPGLAASGEQPSPGLEQRDETVERGIGNQLPFEIRRHRHGDGPLCHHGQTGALHGQYRRARHNDCPRGWCWLDNRELQLQRARYREERHVSASADGESA